MPVGTILHKRWEVKMPEHVGTHANRHRIDPPIGVTAGIWNRGILLVHGRGGAQCQRLHEV